MCESRDDKRHLKARALRELSGAGHASWTQGRNSFKPKSRAISSDGAAWSRASVLWRASYNLKAPSLLRWAARDGVDNRASSVSSLDEECVGSEPSDSIDQCGAKAWSDVAMAFLVRCRGHLFNNFATDRGKLVRTSTSSCDDGKAPRRSGDTTASTKMRNRS